MQQHRVGAEGPRLADLPRIDQEVLHQDRQPGGAHRRQVGGPPAEELLLGDQADPGRPASR